MKKKATSIFILVLVLELIFFAGEMLIPRGYSKWIFYFFPLFLLFNASSLQIIIMVTFVSILEILGLLISPASEIPILTSILNRSSALVILWIFALVYLFLYVPKDCIASVKPALV